eukprot:4723649-Prymnesium_polylepis.1
MYTTFAWNFIKVKTSSNTLARSSAGRLCGANMQLAVALRTRPTRDSVAIEPPQPRPKAERSQRAIANECTKLVTPHPSTKMYAMTAM